MAGEVRSGTPQDDSSMGDRLVTARALLFVPATRPERFGKALASGADLVVIDLEDAVLPAAKDEARDNVATWLRTAPPATVVRINAVGTRWHEADLELVAGSDCLVMLPKAESNLADVTARLGPQPRMLALVETATGVINAFATARTPGVSRLAFGNFDLSAEIGTAPDDHSALQAARSQLVLASAAGGLSGPIDGVTGDISDYERLALDVEHARRLGFTARLCIHPAQVGPTIAGFEPKPELVAWANEVVHAPLVEGVTLLNGHMIDAPVVARARRILAVAGRSNNPSEGRAAVPH